MSTPFGQTWPTSYTTDGVLNAVSVAAGANSANSGTIANSAASPNEVMDTEIVVAVAYGATITGGGATIYVCRRRPGGFQSPTSDAPYSVQQAAVASTTVYTALTLRGCDWPDFQVVVGNPASNSSVTVTLSSRQSQGLSG